MSASPRYQIGDTVVAVNDYGRNNGIKKVTAYEANPIRGNTYQVAPTDTPWFFDNEKNLFKPEDTIGIHYAETHGDVWRRA